MKSLKLLILLAACGLILSGVSRAEAGYRSNSGQTKNFKSWKITMSKSGGYAGMMKSSTLDDRGNLTKRDRDRLTDEKISSRDVEEIEKIIYKLKLPNALMKTVKGQRIYDGIYTSLVITLDDKDYLIEGSSFYDAKYLALTKKQKVILGRLHRRLKSVGAGTV